MSSREQKIQKLIGFAIGGLQEINKDNFSFDPSELFGNGKIAKQTKLEGGKYQFDFEFDVMSLDIESASFLKEKGDLIMSQIRGVTFKEGNSKIGYTASVNEPDKIRISFVSDANAKNIACNLKSKVEVVSDYVAKNVELALVSKRAVETGKMNIEKPKFFQKLGERLGLLDKPEEQNIDKINDSKENLITLEPEPSI